jgi:hypothetical protein
LVQQEIILDHPENNTLKIKDIINHINPDSSFDKKLDEKLTTNEPIDVWTDTFLKANPEQYHQFRQNNRPGTRKDDEHIRRMASRARYKAATKRK